MADADDAVDMGRAAARESYLNIDRILARRARPGADAIHPGYGFLSENWRFAARVRGGGAHLRRADRGG